MAGTVLTLASVAAAAGATRAADHATATTEATIPGGEPTEPKLPRTALEADERDNGHTAQAPYLIWSGIVSVIVVGGGGLLFKRRYDRENAAVRADVAAAKASREA